MYEVLSVLIRQIALVWGTYLMSKYGLDPYFIEPFAGLCLAIFSVGWMIYARFVSPKRKAKKTETEE